MNWENYVNSSFGLGITNHYQFRRHGERCGVHGVDNKLYTVHMSFTRDLVGVVMDRFGTGVTISPIDKGHFTAVVEVYHNAQFVKWVMGLGNKVKILSPDRIIDDVAYYGRAIGRWHKRVEGD